MSEGVLKGARAVLLLSALIYPLAVVAIIVMAVRLDPFTMFRPGYWVLCFVALPVVWGFASILAAWRFAALSIGWLVFHVAVLAVVTFGHFWVMVQFAAGV